MVQPNKLGSLTNFLRRGSAGRACMGVYYGTCKKHALKESVTKVTGEDGRGESADFCVRHQSRWVNPT